MQYVTFCTKKWDKLDPAEPMTFINEEIMQVVTSYMVKKALMVTKLQDLMKSGRHQYWEESLLYTEQVYS